MIEDVTPAEFSPTSQSLDNCRVLSPTTDVIITKCILSPTKAIVEFDVTSNFISFVKV